MFSWFNTIAKFFRPCGDYKKLVDELEKTYEAMAGEWKAVAQDAVTTANKYKKLHEEDLLVIKELVEDNNNKIKLLNDIVYDLRDYDYPSMLSVKTMERLSEYTKK